MKEKFYVSVINNCCQFSGNEFQQIVICIIECFGSIITEVFDDLESALSMASLLQLEQPNRELYISDAAKYHSELQGGLNVPCNR